MLVSVLLDAAAAGATSPAPTGGLSADPTSMITQLWTAAPWLVGPALVLGLSWKWWLSDAFDKVMTARTAARTARAEEKKADREAKALAIKAEREAEIARDKVLHDSRATELDLQRRITEANTALAQNLERGLAASNTMLATMGAQIGRLETVAERVESALAKVEAAVVR